MLRRRPILLIVGFLTACAAFAQDTGHYPFEPIGSRETAMGGATAAMSASPASMYHNPASLVWHKIAIGAGGQPYSTDLNKLFRSWWVHLYNENTTYNVPFAMVLQGWDEPGPNRNAMIGLPIAYGYNPRVPAAVHLKWGWERKLGGEWVGQPLADLGFLARVYSGFTMGLVLRNLTWEKHRLNTMQQRYDFGVQYGGGPITLSFATRLREWDDFKSIDEKWRWGMEIVPGGILSFRGGYAESEADRWYTGGVGLRARGGESTTGSTTFDVGPSALAPFEFNYSLVYRESDAQITHFISYVYFVPN
ncbi:hypothetical protein GF324_04505 [bacterium]|nr:hypothetical protein [bacterium]